MRIAYLVKNQETKQCLNFGHLSMFIVLTLASLTANAFQVNHRVAEGRNPASAFDEEVLTAPIEQKVLIQSLFAEDDAGVMRGVRDTLKSWDDTDQFAEKWHLQSTGLYNTPSISDRKLFISKNILRYADKRLAGEMKNAEEGSTLHSVGQVEKSLRPNATVAVSKYISFKFKVRVLQGKAVMEVRNPWLECNATVAANGKAKIVTKKDIAKTGTSAGVEYSVNDAQWISFVDQEITKNIKARMSSTTQPTSNDADKRIELNASFPFNL